MVASQETHKSRKTHSSAKNIMADRKHVISSVNEALDDWEKSLEAKHQEEMDQLIRQMMEEKEKEMDQLMTQMMEQKQEEIDQLLKQMMRQKEKEMNKIVETSQRIIAKEIKEKQDLEMQVRMLREGWSKEREEWQAKRQALSKDLDPSAGLLDFMTCA